MNKRLLAASEAAGIPYVPDYNGPEQDGCSMFQVNQQNGRRWSAADAFLRPALDRPEPRGGHGPHRARASSSRAAARSVCACATASAASSRCAPSAR